MKNNSVQHEEVFLKDLLKDDERQDLRKYYSIAVEINGRINFVKVNEKVPQNANLTRDRKGILVYIPNLI